MQTQAKQDACPFHFQNQVSLTKVQGSQKDDQVDTPGMQGAQASELTVANRRTLDLFFPEKRLPIHSHSFGVRETEAEVFVQ